MLLGELIAGPIITVLLTFLLLKDGERMWGDPRGIGIHPSPLEAGR